MLNKKQLNKIVKESNTLDKWIEEINAEINEELNNKNKNNNNNNNKKNKNKNIDIDMDVYFVKE